jgi:hypothetical protein
MYSICYLCHILIKLELCRDFRKISSMKIHENPSAGAELLHADGQTNMAKLIEAFRNFGNDPKTSYA